MESKFKPKIGQLVSWLIGGSENVAPKKHIGMITKVFSNNTVEVTFLKNDWVIILQSDNIELINDVVQSE